jgi:hypothetical protein
MVNHSKFKFSSLKDFDIKILDSKLISFHIYKKKATGLIDISLESGLNGRVNVRYKDLQYICNYKSGELDGI